tara:strand:+ start:61 stop:816 length:756 start_codon:yes stop_codon:yes gene_type:complete
MEYSFNIHIAKKYGVDEAIMIKNFQFWILKNEASEKHSHKGSYWTYNSVSSFAKVFPFWTKSQVSRVLKSLIDKNLLKVDNFNKVSYDRTRWYSFTDHAIHEMQKCIVANAEMDVSKPVNGLQRIESPIPDVNTDSKQDNKPNALFPQLIAEYHNFIISKLGVPPKINGAEGKAAKQILSYLLKITEEPIVAWKFVLDHWERVEPFLRNQIKLTQINSNLMNILNQIKNGKSTNKKSTSNLERRIAERLQH